MRKSLLLAATGLLATFAVTATEAHAAEPIHWSSVSLGLGLGDPSALDLKLWTTEDSGFDIGVGLENFDDVFGIYAEYEFGLVAFFIGDDARGTFYVGIGGALSFNDNGPDDDDVGAAVIIPIGLNFRFRAPLELFIEGRPGIALNDPYDFGIGGQIGLRFIF